MQRFGKRRCCPQTTQCGVRVIEWLKGQEDHSVQARLASAQGRLELNEGDDGPGRKRARLAVMSDNWVFKGDKAIRQHRAPRRELYVHVGKPVGSKYGKKMKFSGARRTQVINNGTGEMHEFADNWRQVGPLALDYEWTGWTELTLIDADDNMGKDAPVTRGSPPTPSATTKREAKDMSGEVEDEDQQDNKAPMLDHEDEAISEVRQGLNMPGFYGEVVNWILGNNMDILKE